MSMKFFPKRDRKFLWCGTTFRAPYCVIGTLERDSLHRSGCLSFYTLCDLSEGRIMKGRVSKNGGRRGKMKKNGWILLLFLFLGLLAGALLANWLKEVPGLSF